MSKNPIHQLETTIYDLKVPKRANTFWGFWLTILLAFGLLWIKHHSWLAEPNQWFMGASVDGYKNYMTMAWHVKHDSSYVLYRGMNYPFGEHVLFTDMQPAIASSMQWWNRHVSDISNDTAGIMNVILIISMLFGAGVLFLLFRKLHLPVWYATLASLGILFLSPQNARFDGHFGLSHTWVIPLMLLLLCRYEERHSRRYQSLLIGILLWVAAQLHFYYFGLCAIFLVLYTIFQWALDPSWRNIRARMSHLVVMVLVPFVLLNIWIHWANFSSDRTANPFGFTTYIGYWEGVFLPYEQFSLYKWIDTTLIRIRRVDFEAQAYAGVVAFVFTLYLIFRRFRLFGQNWQEMAYHRVHEKYLRGIFTAAMFLLLFALGFPFAIKGMEWMINFMGPLKQFRGLGRFTWGFYYVINVLAFYVLWNYSVRFKGFNGGKAPWFRWVIALAPMLLLGYEAYTLQKIKKPDPIRNPLDRAYFAPDAEHWVNKIDWSQFQAFFPIPYYHVGSENIWMEIDYNLSQKTYATAYHTGVPDMGVNMSRTPVNQMALSVQLAKIPCEAPRILDEMPDNRPIALLVEPKRHDEMQEPYKHLLRKAQLLYDKPELQVYSLQLDSLRVYQRGLADEMLHEMENNTKYDAGNGWRTDYPPATLINISYDSLSNCAYKFQGDGAYEGHFNDTTYLWKTRLPKGIYNLSMWVKIDKDLGMTHEVKIIENNRGDGHEVHFKHEGLRFYLSTIVNGWALYDLSFEVFEDDSNIRIFLPPKTVKSTFYLDEVVIKRNGFSVYKKTPGWICRNNFYYKLKE